MKRWLVMLATLAAAMLTGCAHPERSRDLGNPAVTATTLAQQVCSACHGMTGVATSPNFPNLAAQTEPYVVAQLQGFKSHTRRDPAGFEYMWGLSRHLSDEQIQGLAAYYAKQGPARPSPPGDAGRLQAGKDIFTSGVVDQSVPACTGCHGDQAQGNASFPRLSGQHADYLIKQLLVFQRTDERPEGSVMKTVAHGLSRKNIQDVAAYLETMP